jgi:hypothetical protein
VTHARVMWRIQLTLAAAQAAVVCYVLLVRWLGLTGGVLPLAAVLAFPVFYMFVWWGGPVRVLLAGAMSAAITGTFSMLAGGFSLAETGISLAGSFLPFLLFLMTIERRPRASSDTAAEARLRGTTSLGHYYRTGSELALSQAIKLLEVGITVLPADDPQRAVHWNALGAARTARYRRTGLPKHLDEATEADRTAVSALDENSPDEGLVLAGLWVAGAPFRNRGSARAP